MVNAEIKLAGKSINLYVIYRPPPSSENRVSCESFLDEIGTLLENSVIDPRPLLITGDFNFHVDNKSDVDANNFSDLLESFNLCQHVMESTHCAGHTLVLIISRNSENILNSLNVVDVPISDQMALLNARNEEDDWSASGDEQGFFVTELTTRNSVLSVEI